MLPMWYEACENSQAFGRLYSSGQGLDRVELFEMVLQPYRGHLRLRVELPRFPDHPPARWDPEASAVQVTVDFWFVDDLKVEGWSHEGIGLLSLSRAADGLHLSFASEALRITARCEVARIDRFTAYSTWPSDEDVQASDRGRPT